MLLLHLADTHFGNNPSRLKETTTVTDFILTQARCEKPDLVILAGDTMDEAPEAGGPIKLDSLAARAAIRFVRELAEVCPVFILRGTRSHDHETPYVFREVRAKHPIHVSTEIEQVALLKDANGAYRWVPLLAGGTPLTVVTALPSVDKSGIYAQEAGTIREGNAEGRTLLHDLLSGFGLVNETLPCPTILAAHGTVTGAKFSSGQSAIGDDLEFSVSALRAAKCQYHALGHIHVHQCFGPDICYSGSPGRNNMGETEIKGALWVRFDGPRFVETEFFQTPARTFAFQEQAWDETGAEGVLAAVRKLAESAQGAHVRLRYTIPEEEAHSIRREDLEAALRAAGAEQVKIEVTVIPKVRARAEGISRLSTLGDKLQKWGETVGEDVTRILDLAADVEGHTADELADAALARLNAVRESRTAEPAKDLSPQEALGLAFDTGNVGLAFASIGAIRSNPVP